MVKIKPKIVFDIVTLIYLPSVRYFLVSSNIRQYLVWSFAFTCHFPQAVETMSSAETVLETLRNWFFELALASRAIRSHDNVTTRFTDIINTSKYYRSNLYYYTMLMILFINAQFTNLRAFSCPKLSLKAEGQNAQRTQEYAYLSYILENSQSKVCLNKILYLLIETYYG